MKPDVIVIWPRGHDYPFFRAFVENNKDKFNKIIVSFTGQDQDSLNPYICDWFKNKLGQKITLIDNTTNDNLPGDWRDNAVNNALKESSSEWVWFLEQDFFMTEDFIDNILNPSMEWDAIGFFEANRLHPACLLIKREIINKTTRDFGVVPDQLDHFGKFTSEVMKISMGKILELETYELKQGSDYYHMQGLTHNYNLVRDNNLTPIFKKDEFLTYNKYAPLVKVDQFPPFIARSKRVAELMPGTVEEPWFKNFLKLYL